MAEETKNAKWMNRATKVGIPVGIRFQATVPKYYSDFSHARNDLSTEKWFGEQTWPVQDPVTSSNKAKRSQTIKRELEEDVIGIGYHAPCLCLQPGSIKCIKRHMKEARMKLQNDLKSAYQNWKFDQIGNVVSKSWSQKECKKFKKTVTKNANDGFMKQALEFLPSKTRRDIVSYYFNVYIPSRFHEEWSKSDSRNIDIDTDGEKDSSRAKKKYLSGGEPSFNGA